MLLSHKVECVTIFFKMYQILWIKKHINWTIQPPLTPQTAKSHGLSQPPFESWKGQRATLSKLRGKQILCKPWWVQRITFNPPTKILKQPLHILLLTNQNHFKLTKNINSNFQIQQSAFAISHHFLIHHRECTHFRDCYIKQ